MFPSVKWDRRRDDCEGLFLAGSFALFWLLTPELSPSSQPAGSVANSLLFSESLFPSRKVSRLVSSLWSLDQRPFSAELAYDHKARQGVGEAGVSWGTQKGGVETVANQKAHVLSNGAMPVYSSIASLLQERSEFQIFM